MNGSKMTDRQEIDRLNTINAELLGACEKAANWFAFALTDGDSFEDEFEVLKAAIAKARRQA